MEGGLVRLRVLFLYRLSGELVLISPEIFDIIETSRQWSNPIHSLL